LPLSPRVEAENPQESEVHTVKIGDEVFFPWGMKGMVEGVIEDFDGPKAQVKITKSVGNPIWISTSLLRKKAK
jgi:hypothetical protein